MKVTGAERKRRSKVARALAIAAQHLRHYQRADLARGRRGGRRHLHQVNLSTVPPHRCTTPAARLGDVMLSASTARLVDGAAALSEPEPVLIKGANEPVTAYRLLGMGEQQRAVGRAESNLVGRR
ncbi:MAG: hypothetical protein ACLQLO_08915 [Mycobacterium sp.]